MSAAGLGAAAPHMRIRDFALGFDLQLPEDFHQRVLD